MLTIELNMYHACTTLLLWALSCSSWLTPSASAGRHHRQAPKVSAQPLHPPSAGRRTVPILNCILYSMGIASINFATLQAVFMIMSPYPAPK